MSEIQRSPWLKVIIGVVLVIVVCGFLLLDLFGYTAIDTLHYQINTTSRSEYPPISPLEDGYRVFPANLTLAPCRPRIYVYPMVEALEPLRAISGESWRLCANVTSPAYLSEYTLYKLLTEEELFRQLYTTKNASEATHFFVPFFGACLLSGMRQNMSVSAAQGFKDYAARIFAHLRTLPYLEKHRDRHMAVHPMDGRTAYYGENAHLFDAFIHLVTNGDRRSRGVWKTYHWKRSIVIPSVTYPLFKHQGQTKGAEPDGKPKRTLEVLFQGNIKAIPDNFNYSDGIRTYLVENFVNLTGWRIGAADGNYEKLLAKARFGLSPEGWTLDTTRTWDYLAYGVIPVIIADGIELPFEDDLDWYSFAVRVARKDLKRLPEILKSISSERRREMHRSIWELYRFMLIEQDAWHYIARGLCRMSDIRAPQHLPIPDGREWRNFYDKK